MDGEQTELPIPPLAEVSAGLCRVVASDVVGVAKGSPLKIKYQLPNSIPSVSGQFGSFSVGAAVVVQLDCPYRRGHKPLELFFIAPSVLLLDDLKVDGSTPRSSFHAEVSVPSVCVWFHCRNLTGRRRN